MVETIMNLLGDYTFQIVAIGAMSLGVLSGISGTFAVLRKQSLLGDSIAHSSLAGIAIAFMMTETRDTAVLLIGALIFGMISTAIIRFFSNNARVNFESSLALVMSSFFGLGLVLLTQIQKMPNANQAGLEKFLFGQAATILKDDVRFTLIMMLIVAMTTLVFFKELKVYSFDPVFTQTIGFNTKVLEIILSAFVVASVITGIQMVGVVLISALLIIPSVAARQWTNKLSYMLLLSSFFGAFSGLIGTLLSTLIDKLPTGPSIVLVASAIVFMSLLFAPNRGIISKKIKMRKARISYKSDMVLIHHFIHHNHSLEETFSFKDVYASTLEHDGIGLSENRVLKNLVSRNYIIETNQNYTLTPQAIEELFGGVVKS